MIDDKLKRGMIVEAARMIYSRREADFHQAKIKAARRLCRGLIKPSDLPTDEEILNEVQKMADLFRCGSTDEPGEIFTTSKYVDTIQQAALNEGEFFCDEISLDEEGHPVSSPRELSEDRFQIYRSLLLPLDTVMQDKHFHPEGDLLYHLLQCYVLARNELPYDEEFQLAALLHDVGTGLDRHHHVEAGLKALDGYVTPRTAWLIEHHMEVYQIRDRTIGHRAHQRLRSSDDYEELLLLGVCDREARVCGAVVPDLDEALDEIRELSQMNE